MKLSNKAKIFCEGMVFNYSKYDAIHNCYILNVNEIPSFDLYELSSILINDCPELGQEATSIDNEYYEKEMLPALKRYLSNVTNKDFEYEYLDAWKKGVVKYLFNIIENGIDDALEEFNLFRKESEKDDYIWAA